MPERPLEPSAAGARAYRNFAEKAKAYAEAMHLHIDEWGSWEWKRDGSGMRPNVPSMRKIEDYYNENLVCLTCNGLKFISRSLNDFSQHGTTICPACRGSGQREFD